MNSLLRNNLGLILFWLSVFIIMDLSILGLNIWISIEIDKDTAAINLAGRQRMLSQRITKGILSIDNQQIQEKIDFQDELSELNASYKLFDQTLLAFKNGGSVLGTKQTPVTLKAVEDDHQRRIIERTIALWNPLKSLLDELFYDKKISIGRITYIRDYAMLNNNALLALMNDLTSTMEDAARDKTRRIRIFQTVAMVLAFVSFMVVLLQVFQRIKFISQNEKFLSIIIDNIDTCVLIHNEAGKIENCNSRSTELFGFERDEIIGENINTLIRDIDSELIGKRKDGTCFFASMEHNALTVDKTPLVIKTVRDISSQRVAEQSLTRLAYYDPLTSLPNRILLKDRMTQEIGRAHRNKKMIAIFFIDLDGFKTVNDTAGHKIGDLLLIDVAKILKASVRQNDSVCRWGGDEFIVMYTDIDNLDSCNKLAENLIRNISGITHVRNRRIQLGASIGISIYPLGSDNPDILVSQADVAMYEAKKSGKNNYRLHQNVKTKTWHNNKLNTGSSNKADTRTDTRTTTAPCFRKDGACSNGS